MSEAKLDNLTKMMSFVQDGVSTILQHTGIRDIGAPGVPGPHWPPLYIINLVPKRILDEATPEQQKKAAAVQLRYVEDLTKAFAAGVAGLVKAFDLT